MNARMHEDGVLGFDHDGLVPEPLDEFVRVGRLEDFSDRVLLVHLARTRRHGQKVQVVVAEQASRPAAEASDAPKGR